MHTQLSKYQAEAYDWINRNFGDRRVEIPARKIAEVVGVTVVGANFILNRLSEYGLIKFLGYSTKLGGARIYFVPRYKRQYEIGGRNTSEFASPRNLRLRKSNVAKQEVLDNLLRSSTRRTYAEIAKDVGMSVGYVTGLMQNLEAEGRIKISDYRISPKERAKERILELINKNATPDRATSWKLTQAQIGAAVGLSEGYVSSLIAELEDEGKVVKGNHTNRGGKSTVYDQSHVLAVTIEGRRALIQGNFTVSYPPENS